MLLLNTGDGQDQLEITEQLNDLTISLGGGTVVSELFFSKNQDDLLIINGQQKHDSINIEDWFSRPENDRPQLNLQVFVEAAAEFDSHSDNPLLQNKVQFFDLSLIAGQINQATDNKWSLMQSALESHLGSSDTEAAGGNIARNYALNIFSIADPASYQTQLSHDRNLSEFVRF